MSIKVNTKIIFAILLIPTQFAWSSNRQTLGELLRQESRGGELKAKEKSQISIPSYTQAAISTRPVTPVDLSKVKPPRTKNFMAEDKSDQAQLERIIDEQISELYKITQQFKKSPRRGEIWIRLAELYVEKSGMIEFKKQTEYDQHLRDFESGKIKTKPKLNLSTAREYNKRAIQLYEWFVRDFPKDEKMDQALFFLGYNNFELGEVKKGLHYYQRLANEFPESAFVVETNFALAEYYFETDEWKKSLDHYSKVIRNKKHRLTTFSLYKTAWAQFRLGRSSEALETMEYLIKKNREDMAAADPNKRGVNRSRLENEALRDLVVIYAEVGSYKEAVSYFEKMAGEKADHYLEKLAYYYSDKGNREGARRLFNHMISKNPTNSKAFEYKYQIVQGWMNATKTGPFKEELYSWVRDFGVNSEWYKANQANTALIESSQRQRETTLKIWILNQHQTAQNSKAKFSQNLANEGYELYIEQFPNASNIGDMHFYHGELLYDMEKFDEAAAEYQWVVKNAPQSKFHQKAAENIIISLEKDLPKDSEIEKQVGKNVDPVEFAPRVLNFVESASAYLVQFPNSDKQAEIKFRIGRLYYQHNQFEKAIPMFTEILKKHPKTKYAEYSANLLLDIYSLKKDYSGLEVAAQELLAIPAIMNSPAGKDIQAVLERSKFKKAQDVEGNKDFQKSAEHYVQFAEQNAKSPLAISARYNAALNYERAGLNQKAIEQHKLVLINKSAESEKLKPQSQRIIAKLYQDSGQLENAAQEFEKSAKITTDKKLQRNMLFNAAVLYEAVGKVNKSVENYNAYMEDAKSSEKSDVLWSIAQMQKQQNQKSKAVEAFSEYVKVAGIQSEKGIEASFWCYFYSSELGRKSDSEEWKLRVLSAQSKLAPQKKGIGASYAARIKLAEAVNKFDEFKALKLPKDPKKQQQIAKQKIELLQKLNSQLADVIKYDSADQVVGSLSLLGQANLNMYEALVGAPLPPGLNAQEAEQYKAGIQKIADPFMQKAKESLKASIDRSSELEAYNAYAVKAKEILNSIQPNSVKDGGEVGYELKQGSWVGL